MAQFDALKVENIQSETEDTVSISFEIPQELKSKYNFVAGQYLTLRKEINGEDVRRSYSICSGPSDGEVRVAVKQIENGLFSTFANDQLREGEVLEVMPPMGNFTFESDASRSQHYLLICAGSGITPVISIAKSILEKEPNSKVSMLYGNRTAEQVIFKSNLDQLASSDRFSLHYIYSRQSVDGGLHEGRITAEKIEDFKSALDFTSVNEVYLCGPEQMIHDVSAKFEAMGIDKKKIHFELFTTTASNEINEVKRSSTSNFSGESSVCVIVDGEEIEFTITDGSNILDAAMENDADVPFACKGGVCCTCKIKVVEGEVEMDVNYALEPEEVEQGFALACQARPKSARVVADFDDIF